MTYTYALMEVSESTYREISQKLWAAGYRHAFHEDQNGQPTLDMHGIALIIEEKKPCPNL